MERFAQILVCQNRPDIIERGNQDIGELVSAILEKGSLGRFILQFEEALDFVRHLIVLSRATDMWR